tara:strand:+ start:2473 stop:3822 length:1350 start_codon:yes stop_codon:yes gene_type:complete
MMSTKKRIKKFILLAGLSASMTFPAPSPVMAACSPGIPCTGYTITANPTSNTDPSLNGPKTGQPVVSGAHAGGACDGDFMNQIHARAFMEANRDVIMSEQIIRKPDSVLEYTCFDEMINATAVRADRIFSAIQDGDDGDFVNRNVALLTDEVDGEIDTSDYSCSTSPCVSYSVVFPDSQMDTVIQNAVMAPMRTYINSNFAHTYLGGASAQDSNMSSVSDPYSCGDMTGVWDEAKCIDFGSPDDFFRSFEELAEGDPRTLPAVCGSGPAASNPSPSVANTALFATGTLLTLIGDVSLAFPVDSQSPCPVPAGSNTPATGITEDIINVSRNCEFNYVRFDLFENYFEFIKSPLSTNATGDIVSNTATGHPAICSAPIPTGVPVVTYRKTPVSTPEGIETYTMQRFLHYDHVCVNPGCRYVPVSIPWLWNISAMPTVPASTAAQCVLYNIP